MIKGKSLLLAAIAAVTFSSCANTKIRTYDYTYINKQGVIQKPLTAELDVNNTKATLSKTYSHITVSQAKENAFYDFSKENNCDLVIQPMYSIDANSKVVFSSDKWEEVKIELTGFPAKYKNIQPFQLKDTASFKINAFINNEHNKPIESIKEKKSSTGKIVLWSVLGLLAAGALGSAL